MRILIADTQPKVRFAIRVLLERQPDVEVTGEAVSAAELLQQFDRDCPDALLLGWELPGMAMEQLLAALRRSCPEAVIIALSGRLEAQRVAIESGADAFVSKSSPPEQLLAAISHCDCRCAQDSGASSKQDANSRSTK
jgi:DNA-binding NarL/FixJ family response regulator